MCGFAGIFDTVGQRDVDRDLLGRMTRTLIHRGPDGGGEHLGPGIGLGHRRLAVIDIGGGDQPMYNEDQTIAVVFNGEIYNFRALATELEAAGHRFRSRCDTEVIVHAWEQWGAECVGRFRGMFAFALWDAPRQTLCLARDHLGKKPLYWSHAPGGRLLFASELKGVMACDSVPRRLNDQAIEEYFSFGYVPDPHTIYSAVHKLPPAHRLVWRRGTPAPAIEPYWDLRYPRPESLSLDDAAEGLRARLIEATRCRLVADVPLGAFLSGGVDSGAVVATMAKMSARPVKTFTIAVPDPAYDESALAGRLAGRYHTDHHVQALNPDDIDLVGRLASIYDEPFGDSSAMPTFRVCELARRSVTVALSGDGGDEQFAGYRRYAMQGHTALIRKILPQALRRPVFGALGRLYPKADWAPRWLRGRTTFQELATDAAGAYHQAVSVIDGGQRQRLFSPAFRRRLQGYSSAELLRQHMQRADTDDLMSQLQYADLKTWLPGGVLVKVDRAAMANSLEVRAPLLDVDLLEWSAGLPTALKVRGNSGKLLLKRAMEPLVDREILYGVKRGFSVPLARWFRGPLRGRMLALADSPRLGDSTIVDREEIRRMVAAHLSGRRDHAAGLWLVLMFDAFLAAEDL